jgi:NADH:ubiquinone reductase (H+-translocating)
VRVLVVGGGYIGMYACRKLQRRLRRRGHELLLVSDENFMQYQPFLPEAASGNIEPRHVVVPLRRVLKHTTLLTGEVTGVDHRGGKADVRTLDGATREVPYDVLVYGLGSVSRVLPIPGLAERAVGFKTISEAIHLRNQVLARLEAASEAEDHRRRESALTFVFVGGGYAGVEAMAELEDLARAAIRSYPRLRPEDIRWVLVEAAGSILPEIGDDLAAYTVERLRRRGIDIRLNTRLESAEKGVISLSDGAAFPADTLVWTAGVRPHPLAARSGLPVDGAGRVLADEFLRIRGLGNAWAAGDGTAVPDLTRPGQICPPTAQHALRQARRLARNLLRALRGRPPKPFRYANRGQLVGLGRYKGVARVMGLRLRGFPAWWLHRSYHLLMMPTVNRKVRIALDWTVGLFFRRDITSLGSLQRPWEPFRRAAGDGREPPSPG